MARCTLCCCVAQRPGARGAAVLLSAQACRDTLSGWLLGPKGAGRCGCIHNLCHGASDFNCAPGILLFQVLSRGGDVAADRLEDTTAAQQQRRRVPGLHQLPAQAWLSCALFSSEVQRPWAFLLTSPATGLAASLLCCSNGTFLPSAFIMGLQPGSSLDAEVRCCCE